MVLKAQSRIRWWVAACACLAILYLAGLAASASAESEKPYAPIGGDWSVLSAGPFEAIAPGPVPQAGTPYIDGISDQSPPPPGLLSGGLGLGGAADGSTATADDPMSHIAIARYVVQWNVMSGAYPAYRAELEAWYADVVGMGLSPDISLMSYDGIRPSSTVEYRTRLEQLLDRFKAIRYLEPWNEPNNTSNLAAGTAAGYANSAYALCQDRGCTSIVGDFLDSQTNLLSYEKEYEQALSPANPPDWGIHPYGAVKTRNASTILDYRSNLPNGGVGDRLWFTEVGAYRCEDYVHYQAYGEREQALDVSWLVNRLMPAVRPVHVLYYELLYKSLRPPPCDATDPDTALYVPAADDLNVTYAPRAAAGYVHDGRGAPFAYTGRAALAGAGQATLSASVYPGGFLHAKYHFEYGLTSGYGSYSREADAGSVLGRVGVGVTVSGLQAGVTYRYRVVAWNAEGAVYGSDRTFTTPPRSA